MPTRLILIRHGETAWNRQKRYCGSVDIGLNGTGRRQAKRLKRRLKGEKIEKVYSSGRLRALQTARIIFAEKNVETLPGLNEMHFGVLEGLTHAEASENHPFIYSRWLKDPFEVRIPGGEELNKFKRRVTAAIGKTVKANSGRTIALVCHGGSIGIYLSYILKSKDFWRMIPSSTAVTIIEFARGRPKVSLSAFAEDRG